MNTEKPNKTASKHLSQRQPGSRKKSPAKSPNVRTGRQAMIAEAAYYRAEKRGFTFGLEDRDWLEAEKEIDTMLSSN